MAIGAKLRELREKQGLSIREVVTASGGALDKTTLSRIERDERGLSLKAAYLFSQIYNISMDELCEMAVNNKAKPARPPFDASATERKLIETYRELNRKRQRTLDEVAKGLRMLGDAKSGEHSRHRLLEELDRARGRETL
jgi:transcriptional regulator with XRE-family HTH domain